MLCLKAGMMGAVFVTGLLAINARGQELVNNGGFELPVVANPWAHRLPGSSFGGWTVDNVGQGIVQVASFGRPNAVEGLQCLELNFYDTCGVSQAIATQPGTLYTLTFMMAGQNDVGPDVKTMLVQWGGTTIDTASWSRSASGGQWQRHTHTVTATSANTVIHFFGQTSVDGGPYLDAVSVVCAADYNHDQVVDFFDYLDFVDAMSHQGLESDFNNDGIVDFFDYLDFLVAFGSGC